MPKNTLIVIVADHGMITADPEACIDIASEPQLMRGVANVGGEPRCVMLYGEDGENPEDIAARWRDVLGERARCAPAGRQSRKASTDQSMNASSR